MSSAKSIDQLMDGNTGSISIGSGLSIKSLIFLFIIIICTLSTAFTNYVISSFKGAFTDNKEITSFGTMIQAICIVLLFTVTQLLENYNIL